MKLHHDPFRIFRFSKTPAGLYARQKWLGDDTPQWQTNFRDNVGAVLADQQPGGSWYHKTVTTIIHLFKLLLTVRSSTQWNTFLSEEELDHCVDVGTVGHYTGDIKIIEQK